MKLLKVTNMLEMFDVLDINPNQSPEETDMDNIDDDFGGTSFNIGNACTPTLPQREFNIATLTPQKLEELRKSSK